MRWYLRGSDLFFRHRDAADTHLNHSKTIFAARQGAETPSDRPAAITHAHGQPHSARDYLLMPYAESCNIQCVVSDAFLCQIEATVALLRDDQTAPGTFYPGPRHWFSSLLVDYIPPNLLL